MPRQTLDESRLHPSVRERVANHHADIVHNVQAAAASHPVLVVGMRLNPFCHKARKQLTTAGVAHHYLEYGGYLSQWRARNALKMWSGWPTFPMVFVKGVLIGGASDLARMIEQGELRRELAS
jgi:monothiol glutaredoxin